MALTKAKYSEIPKDAVILSEKEAVKYQTDIILNWAEFWDTCLCGATVMSSIYLNNYFRRKFKLLHYGRVASYLPICAMPSILSVALHTELILKKLLLMKGDECPTCLQSRAAVCQVITGVLIPSVLAPAGGVLLAHRYLTYRLPSVLNDPKGVLKEVQKHYKPIRSTILYLCIGQAILASAITYFEANSVFTVNRKLAKLDKPLEFDVI